MATQEFEDAALEKLNHLTVMSTFRKAMDAGARFKMSMVGSFPASWDMDEEDQPVSLEFTLRGSINGQSAGKETGPEAKIMQAAWALCDAAEVETFHSSLENGLATAKAALAASRAARQRGFDDKALRTKASRRLGDGTHKSSTHKSKRKQPESESESESEGELPQAHSKGATSQAVAFPKRSRVDDSAAEGVSAPKQSKGLVNKAMAVFSNFI
jgi:hypothetical protein